MPYKRLALAAAFSLTCLSALPGCQSDRVCVPNASQACACADGNAGAQTCNATGSAFNDCVCKVNPALGTAPVTRSATAPVTAPATAAQGTPSSPPPADKADDPVEAFEAALVGMSERERAWALRTITLVHEEVSAGLARTEFALTNGAQIAGLVNPTRLKALLAQYAEIVDPNSGEWHVLSARHRLAELLQGGLRVNMPAATDADIRAAVSEGFGGIELKELERFAQELSRCDTFICCEFALTVHEVRAARVATTTKRGTPRKPKKIIKDALEIDYRLGRDDALFLKDKSTIMSANFEAEFNAAARRLLGAARPGRAITQDEVIGLSTKLMQALQQGYRAKDYSILERLVMPTLSAPFTACAASWPEKPWARLGR